MTEGHEDAAMRRWFASMPPLPVPQDLAGRIMREVPGLPQSTDGVASGTPPVGRPAAQVIVSGLALWQRPAPPVARTTGGLWLTRAGQLAAMAAAVAAVLVLPQTRGAQGNGPTAAPIARKDVPAPPALRTVATRAASPVVMARRLRIVPHAAPPPGDDDRDKLAEDPPAVIALPLPAGPAVAVAGPLVGPTDTLGGVPAQLGAHGVMGPVLPQGYGYAGSGGAPGGDFGMASGRPAPGGPGAMPH